MDLVNAVLFHLLHHQTHVAAHHLFALGRQVFQACLLYTSCTFGLFTNGLEKFDEYYHQGYLDYVITTNLNYRTQELIDREWYLEADMSKYLAAVINSMNHDLSLIHI